MVASASLKEEVRGNSEAKLALWLDNLEKTCFQPLANGEQAFWAKGLLFPPPIFEYDQLFWAYLLVQGTLTHPARWRNVPIWPFMSLWGGSATPG